MRITDLMIEETMIMNLKSTSKDGAMDELIASLASSGRINDPVLFKEMIYKREAESSTGIGGGIAMPHAKTSAVNEPTVVFAKSEAGVDFESLDGEPAHVFFMIAAPEGAGSTHLRTLAALSRLLIDNVFIERLLQTKTPNEVTALFNEKQAEEAEGSEKSEHKTHSADSSTNETLKAVDQAEEIPFVVAVTACPTGIAHTFMAEDALKKKAQEMGVHI